MNHQNQENQDPDNPTLPEVQISRALRGSLGEFFSGYVVIGLEEGSGRPIIFAKSPNEGARRMLNTLLLRATLVSPDTGDLVFHTNNWTFYGTDNNA